METYLLNPSNLLQKNYVPPSHKNFDTPTLSMTEATQELWIQSKREKCFSDLLFNPKTHATLWCRNPLHKCSNPEELLRHHTTQRK